MDKYIIQGKKVKENGVNYILHKGNYLYKPTMWEISYSRHIEDQQKKHKLFTKIIK